MQIGRMQNRDHDPILRRDFRRAEPGWQRTSQRRTGEQTEKLTTIGRTNIHGKSAAILTTPPPRHNLYSWIIKAAGERELKERGIDFEFEDHKIAHSIYFRDPDGFDLEITTYEIA